ncbi:RNA polymerase sigma-70 factor [Chitinophaga sp. 22321]|uniref:RNA polymerase sigma-70 factor n=1 Tax=Chitinophaga TaxID=79328 RepID=UPI0031FE9A24
MAAGDEAAFAHLFHTYHQQLGDYICRITGSITAAEEIVQDAFVKIWTKRHLLSEVDNIRSYLYRLCRNQTLNALRQLAKEKANQNEWRRNTEGIADEGIDKESYLRLIDEAVAKLPPQQQKAYLLSRKHDLTHEEIAHQMSISRGTVKKHIQLAVKFITDYVRQHAGMPVIALGIFCDLL